MAVDLEDLNNPESMKVRLQTVGRHKMSAFKATFSSSLVFAVFSQ